MFAPRMVGVRCCATIYCASAIGMRGVTDVTIDYPGSDLHPDRLVFGLESIGQAVTVTLYSSVGRATIVGTGNGRYEVR